MSLDRNALHYRKATQDDRDTIIRMRVDFLKDIGNIKSGQQEKQVFSATEWFFDEENSGNDFITWLAEYEGSVIATCGMIIWRKMPSIGLADGRTGYIINVYTKPEYRGNGICTELLRKMLSEAKSLGLERIQLNATQQGYPIYKELGFAVPDNPEMILRI